MTKEEFEKLSKTLPMMPLVHHNLTAHRSEGVKYFKYRILRPILKAKYASFQKQNPEAPWLSPGSIYLLGKILNKEMVGFEFGSGRSTVFYGGLLKHITSIEHYEPWYDKVKQMLNEKGVTNAELKLIQSDSEAPSQHLSSDDQLFMTEDDYPVKDEAFETYSSALKEYPDNHFDFIAVDGRARCTCTLKSIPKLKSGGFLLLDNAERLRYKKALKALSSWPRINTTTGLTDTTIWLKP